MANNAYKQGYQNGHSDAESGKGKNYRGMRKGIMSFDFNNYAKQYCLGYDEGYRIGMREITKYY